MAVVLQEDRWQILCHRLIAVRASMPDAKFGRELRLTGQEWLQTIVFQLLLLLLDFIPLWNTILSRIRCHPCINVSSLGYRAVAARLHLSSSNKIILSQPPRFPALPTLFSCTHLLPLFIHSFIHTFLFSFWTLCLQIENVRMLDRYNSRKPSTGTLYLTATHLIFVDPDAKKETWVRNNQIVYLFMTFHFKIINNFLPYLMDQVLLMHVATVQKLPLSTIGAPLQIRCKTFLSVTFVLPKERECHDLYTSLTHMSQPCENYASFPCTQAKCNWHSIVN